MTTLLRALVVEDERPARNYLVRAIHDSGLAEVVGAVATADEARQALEAGEMAIDVAFLDVELGRGGDAEGLELLRRFAVQTPGRASAREGAVRFVLATASPQHAVEAFALDAVDYLLKPFTDERVAQCLRRVASRAAAAEPARVPSRIVARRKKSLVFLPTSSLWAFEAAERLTYVHASSGKFDLDLSLASVEASFGAAFLRVHRGWLVSEDHVRELSFETGERTLFVGAEVGDPSGIRVPVARERAGVVRERLTGIRER